MDVCLAAALSPLDFALCLFLQSPFQKIAPVLFLEICLSSFFSLLILVSSVYFAVLVILGY